MVGARRSVRAYQDPAALGVVDGAEGGELAEAAAAVADDEPHGAAPPEAGVARRVLGRDVEVLVQIPLHARPAAPSSLHACLLLPLLSCLPCFPLVSLLSPRSRQQKKGSATMEAVYIYIPNIIMAGREGDLQTNSLRIETLTFLQRH